MNFHYQVKAFRKVSRTGSSLWLSSRRGQLFGRFSMKSFPLILAWLRKIRMEQNSFSIFFFSSRVPKYLGIFQSQTGILIYLFCAGGGREREFIWNFKHYYNFYFFWNPDDASRFSIDMVSSSDCINLLIIISTISAFKLNNLIKL